MITLRDLRLTIGTRALFEGVNLRARSGELLAILGPNGVGKTTLLRAITGLHPLAAGSVEIEGRTVHALSPAERARSVAYVTSDEAVTEALRVRDLVAIGRYPHQRWWEWQPRPDDAAAVEAALADVHIAHLGDRLFTTLSSGERQRAWIAMGLAQQTPVILLDEPTSHLDIRVAHELLRLLRALASAGKTVVCVLHDINDAAAYADRIALFGCGALLACEAPDALLGGPFIEQAYGQPMERVRTRAGKLRVFATDDRT